MAYITTKPIETIMRLSAARLEAGVGTVLLLTGPPGGGKTAFSKEMASRLEASHFYYSGSPDKERDLLYEIDVQGVLNKGNAWVPGPAWEAFECSISRRAVLLIDEVDKTAPGFDSFLLRLLEEFKFRAPSGETISGVQRNLVVILTSNGRRELRPEVLRRCRRVNMPLPDKEGTLTIVRSILEDSGIRSPNGLTDLVVRLGMQLRAEGDKAPSPKEMANLCVDLVLLRSEGLDSLEAVEETTISWLCKGTKLKCPFNFVRALKNELKN